MTTDKPRVAASTSPDVDRFIDVAHEYVSRFDGYDPQMMSPSLRKFYDAWLRWARANGIETKGAVDA